LKKTINSGAINKKSEARERFGFPKFVTLQLLMQRQQFIRARPRLAQPVIIRHNDLAKFLRDAASALAIVAQSSESTASFILQRIALPTATPCETYPLSPSNHVSPTLPQKHRCHPQWLATPAQYTPPGLSHSGVTLRLLRQFTNAQARSISTNGFVLFLQSQG
jgi:hypothetical protein